MRMMTGRWILYCLSHQGSPAAAAAAAKSLQSCSTLCKPIDGSPPGSHVPGILQARTLEWVAISFSKAWKRKVKVKLLSCVWPSATPWTAAFQAAPSMGFSRQEYWRGVPLPSPIVDAKTDQWVQVLATWFLYCSFPFIFYLMILSPIDKHSLSHFIRSCKMLTF